jgi:hypothetical protein
MKTTSIKNLMGLSLIAVALTACGGDNNNDRYGIYSDGNYAGCQIPVDALKERTVRGSFGDGGLLQIDLFLQGSNAVAAVGQLTIPSLESLFGTDVFNGTFTQNPPVQGYGYNGPNSRFQTCVSTNGFTGSIDDGQLVQVLNLALQGPSGVFLQMGDTIGYLPVAVLGVELEGDFKLQIPGYPESGFKFVRP